MSIISLEEERSSEVSFNQFNLRNVDGNTSFIFSDL